MQKARGHPHFLPKKKARLPPLVGTRFQVLFHPPPGVLFTFPSRYSFAIGHGRVFSLGRWSCQIQSGFHVSRPTQEMIQSSCERLRLRGCHPLWLGFPSGFDAPTHSLREPAGSHGSPLQPRDSNGCRLGTIAVWAVPLSLAATQGISVDFFSCSYLDVSVHRVRLPTLCIQIRILSKLSGFPHSEIPG